jgi:hypothetical protein
MQIDIHDPMRRDSGATSLSIGTASGIILKPNTASAINEETLETILIVSFKLPIMIERGRRGELIVQHSKSILFNTLFNLQQRNKNVRTVWIGWPGIIPNSDEE